MAKYRNIKQFSKPVTIAGKRYVLKPNETVFSERELDLNIYDFLVKVEDSAKLSTVKELVKQKIEIPSAQDIKNLKTRFEDIKKDVITLQSTPKEVSEAFLKIQKLQTDIETIFKRLDVLKEAVEKTHNISQDAVSAIQSLEQEVYENGGIIITGLDEEEPKQ